ncbi:MAG TPA: sugar phosphate nucleotidyltransferase [Candidatus Limnocylindrales bacterium]|jgi:mannose-1-phosphate guanylyltransferase
MYVVIMAGGGGTRLWPLSRPERPKPFLPLLGDESLLQRTVARLLDGNELDLAGSDITVVTDRRYAVMVHEQLPGVRVLGEPLGRNTAAAIALATTAIDRPDEEVMAVLPADHHMDPEREGMFRGVLADAERELAEGAFDIEDPLVTLGVQMTRPATEYGYLVPDESRRQGPETGHRLVAYRLSAFEEKPPLGRAQELYAKYGVAWNAGMFLWRRRAIRAALERYTGLLTLIATAVHSPAALESAYDRLTPISIDHAVMEGAASDGRVVMGALDVGWSDLGNWTALLEAIAGPGSGIGRVVPPGEALELDGDDLAVRSIDGKLVLEHGPGGTMASDLPMAHLAHARARAGAIEALLDRVQAQETQA